MQYYGQIKVEDNKVMMHGIGREIWQNGDIYEGQLLNGQRNGFGRYIWGEDGKYYEGEWKENK